MPIRFDQYRIKNGDYVDENLFNRVFQDMDRRIAANEGKSASYDAATAALQAAALSRLDQIMAPVVDRFEDYASLGALLTASSDSQIETGDGVKVFEVVEEDRQKFAPSAYLAIIKTGDPTQAMLGTLVAFNADNGQLTVDIDRFEGSGFHEGWTITAASATDNAAAIPAVDALKTAAETAAGQALTRKNEAEAARDQALGYKDDAEEWAVAAHAEAETADDARNQAQIAQTATELARDQALGYMEGFLGTFLSTAVPTTRQDGSPLQVGNWGFKEVDGTPDTYFIDYVASVGPVVWRSLTAAADTSVTSFAGRVGGVNPVAGDYTATMVTATAIAGLTGTDVQTILASIKTSLDTKAASAIAVTGTGLATGGGDLTANRTINVPAASQAEAEAGVENTKAMTALRTKQAILALAPAPGAASETVSGIVELATSAETVTGTDTTRAAHSAGVKAAIDAAIAALVASAPGVLNTLDELAAALGDDPNFATTITASIATKLNSSAYTAADVLSKLLTVDGAASGLDADVLDGQQGAWYADIPARLGYTPLNSTSYTAADVLAKLLTVDGAASGLDADTLDGLQAAAFALITTSISAGTGLSGGGSLAASRTLSFDSGWGDARYAAAAHVGAGGAAHANAVASGAAGFMTGADKAKLDGLVAGGPDYQAFTASGTWTKPAGLTGNEIVVVEEWGGGGGARQNGTDWHAVGGGGGEYRMFFLRAGDLSATESVTVGAGGAAGSSGTAGGFSSFKGVEAAGGRGGVFGGAHGGATRSGNVATAITSNMLNGAGYTAIAAGGEPGGYGAYDNSEGLHFLPQNTINSGGGGGSAKASYRTGGTSVRGGAGGTSTGTAGGAGVAPGGGGAGGTSTAGDGARGEVRVTVLRS